MSRIRRRGVVLRVLAVRALAVRTLLQLVQPPLHTGIRMKTKRKRKRTRMPSCGCGGYWARSPG